MITFIVPSFNQGEYIGETLRTVLDNMREGDELIVADGCSTDSTHEVLAAFENLENVKLIVKRDRGYSDAVKGALFEAKNDVVGIMSSDDLYVQGIREAVDEALADPDVSLVYGDYNCIDENGNVIGKRQHRSGSAPEFARLDIILPQSSVFFKKSHLNAVCPEYLDIEYDYVADVVLFNEMALDSACKVVYVPVVLSSVRRHDGSRTGARNPGIQYLHYADGPGKRFSSQIRRSMKCGGHLLAARYFASSGSRFEALRQLRFAIALDKTIVLHWLFKRVLVYLVFGPAMVDRIKASVPFT